MDKEKLASLAERVRNGDNTAMDELFSATAKSIYYYCQKVMGDPNPDVMLNKIYNYAEKNISAYPQGDDFMLFLRYIASSFCAEKMGLKGNGSEYWTTEYSDGLPDVQEVETEDIINTVVYSEVIKFAVPQMLSELSPSDRFCAYSYYYFNFSPEQIASIADVPEASVQSRMKAIRFGIKTNMKFYSNLREEDADDINFSRQLIQSFILGDAARLSFAAVRNEDIDIDKRFLMPKQGDSVKSMNDFMEYKNKMDELNLRKKQRQIESENNKKKKDKKKSVIFIILAIVLSLAIIGGTVYAILTIIKNSKEVRASSILFENMEITVKTGEKTVLTPIFTPGNAEHKEVVWQSDNEKIVSVDKETGEITGISTGSTYVRARSTHYKKDGKYLEAVCLVNVSEEVFGQLKTLAFSEMQLSLEIGEKHTLVPIYYPDDVEYKDLIWQVQDESIVSLDSTTGEITALKTGNTLVRAISSYYTDDDDNLIIAYCNVNVYEKITSIETKVRGTTIAPGEKYQIELDVVPESSKKNVSFISRDTDIATVDENGVITAVGYGDTLITIKSNDSQISVFTVFTVTVEDKKVEKINVKTKEISVKVNEVLDVKEFYDVFPADAKNKAVGYECTADKEKYYEIEGIFGFSQAGSYLIFIKSVENPNIHDYIRVIVTE
ncbi:MAG: Ig-like domain-containing protein [Clostridia bacterium]|nr:Ig-like domain-containing protein [Clostridia bacterium]